MPVPASVLLKTNGCACGREHICPVKDVLIGKGVLASLPDEIARLGGKKAFILSDGNTYEAAGKTVCDLLDEAGTPYALFCFDKEKLVPDEKTVGSAFMHFDASCDVIVGVGSGVINDISKLLAACVKVPYIIVGTAPSMDGYASGSSSMERDGLKVSLNTKTPDVIIGDVDVLKNAPEKMLIAGLGDMLAKYVSITEWRISHLINGEYYCEEVASLVRGALKKCVDNADGLLKREETAVAAVFEGLVIGGVAMTYAGLSRPASGVEHYVSHIWDMRGVAFGTHTELHGLQCAVGTLIAAKAYEKLKTVKPDREKALAHAAAFDVGAWNEVLRENIGKGAESMIALEEKEGKYDVNKHAARLEVILSHWDDILAIMAEELPPVETLTALYDRIGMPKTPEALGIDGVDTALVLKMSKDIRDKYVLSRLLWDIGEE